MGPMAEDDHDAGSVAEPVAEPDDAGRLFALRVLEHHGIAAVACRGNEVFWANPVAMDLVDPLDRDLEEPALIELLSRGFRAPDEALALDLGVELVVDVELAANRALIRASAVAIGLTHVDGPMVLFTFRAPLETPTDPAHVARLEAMLDSTSDIITVIDGQGRIRFSNPAAGRLTGVAGAEANGTEMFSFVHPEDVEIVADAFERGVIQGEPIDPLDLRIRMADGEWHHTEARLAGPVDIDGVDGYVVTVTDVSDRVRRDQENLLHRRRLESIVENIDDVIVLLDPELSVLWASPGIERLIDAPAYTNVGENAFNDMHPDDVEGVLAAIRAAMDRPDGRSTTSLRLRHQRLGWRWLDAVVVNRLDDAAVGGLVCTLRDVTDERQGDDDTIRRRVGEREEVAALRAADQLKDRFLATVSHELRTPLASVRGFSSLLEGQWDTLDADTRSDLVSRISANAREMERLIEQLLDFSRLQAGAVHIEMEPLDLTVAVESMVDSLQHHLVGHEVAVEVAGQVMADRNAFAHVLRNLITNAARYSQAGSPIEITSERIDDTVEIRVRDHGIGIAPEDQGRVFQSFFQSTPGLPHRRGTGIGLNIARRYAQLQSGHLTLESALGEGSTFTFTLSVPDGAD